MAPVIRRLYAAVFATLRIRRGEALAIGFGIGAVTGYTFAVWWLT